MFQIPRVAYLTVTRLCAFCVLSMSGKRSNNYLNFSFYYGRLTCCLSGQSAVENVLGREPEEKHEVLKTLLTMELIALFVSLL